MSEDLIEEGAIGTAQTGADANLSLQAGAADDVQSNAFASATTDLFGPAGELLDKGGVAIWAIAVLSVLTLAIILWKIWRYAVTGVWRRTRAETAVELWLAGEDAMARETASQGRGVRARVTGVAIESALTRDVASAREETIRVAKGELAQARSGLRALELIAAVAPLLGLFGTVLGMIAAFQTLQAAGSRADPAALAGGIWEALLTTAAGMAVAIPASAALTWFESTTDRLRLDLEDIATRVFTRPPIQSFAHAAE
ncbi:MAG: MotA/TolQ/ExbB proton channel family protein [Pseudomonadota bacterium]